MLKLEMKSRRNGYSRIYETKLILQEFGLIKSDVRT